MNSCRTPGELCGKVATRSIPFRNPVHSRICAKNLIMFNARRTRSATALIVGRLLFALSLIGRKSGQASRGFDTLPDVGTRERQARPRRIG